MATVHLSTAPLVFILWYAHDIGTQYYASHWTVNSTDPHVNVIGTPMFPGFEYPAPFAVPPASAGKIWVTDTADLIATYEILYPLRGYVPIDEILLYHSWTDLDGTVAGYSGVGGDNFYWQDLEPVGYDGCHQMEPGWIVPASSRNISGGQTLLEVRGYSPPVNPIPYYPNTRWSDFSPCFSQTDWTLRFTGPLCFGTIPLAPVPAPADGPPPDFLGGIRITITDIIVDLTEVSFNCSGGGGGGTGGGGDDGGPGGKISYGICADVGEHDAVLLTWNSLDAVYSSANLGLEVGTAWATPTLIAPIGSMECGCLYPPQGEALAAYDQSGAARKRVSQQAGYDTWDAESAGVLTGWASVGRSWDGRKHVFAVVGGDVTLSLASDNATWESIVVISGAQGPHCGGADLGNQWGCAYLDASDNIPRWIVVDTYDDWSSPVSVDMDGTQTYGSVTVAYTDAFLLAACLWKTDGTTGLTKVVVSYDGGATWETAVTVSTVPTTLNAAPVIVAKGNRLYLLWQESDVPASSYSEDGGTTWI